MKRQNTIVLISLLVIIGGVIFYIESVKPLRLAGLGDKTVNLGELDDLAKQEKAAKYGPAREIVSPAGFINVESLNLQDLIGKKVILLDFWTYSCINCQRTLPYLTGWYEKYKDQGLEIVGIHTPEFEFEKKIENVKWATEKYSIKYPVVLDNDYGTWNNYRNRYWPRKYLIDIDGFIVYDHIGEGGYQETEKKIQALLAERAKVLNQPTVIAGDMVNPQAVETVSGDYRRSPEIYFGSWRNDALGNGRRNWPGEQNFSAPKSIKTNALYLVGNWDINKEYAQNLAADVRIIFRYQAQKVFMVAGADSPVGLKILVDGKAIDSRVGSDVIDGTVTVKEERLYRIIEDQAAGEHTLEIIIQNPGLRAFTFTFG